MQSNTVGRNGDDVRVVPDQPYILHAARFGEKWHGVVLPIARFGRARYQLGVHYIDFDETYQSIVLLSRELQQNYASLCNFWQPLCTLDMNIW